MEEIVSEILSRYKPGDLITHSYLRELFNIPEIDIENYATTQELITELQNMQFKYMALVDKLREELLFTERYYLKNVRGDGYSLLPPKEQVAYAFDQGIQDIKKIIRQSRDIMINVRHEEIPFEQNAKDNDMLTRMSNFAQIFSSKRK